MIKYLPEGEGIWSRGGIKSARRTTHFEEQTLVLTCDKGSGVHIPNHTNDGEG